MRVRRAFGLGLAAILGVAAAFLVACGGSDEGLIPGGSARAMQSHLDAVRNAVAAERCARTRTGLNLLRQDFERLPATVDRDLRAALMDGITKLSKRAFEECVRTTTQKTTPTVTETTTTETTTTDTTPTVTTTAPTTTVPPTTPTSTTPPTTTTGTGGATVPTVTTPGAEGEK